MKKRYYVGVGASAGGLEALSSFFSSLPSNTGATYIVVQHLSPDFKSLMDELLRKYTKMDIFIAENGMKTVENAIYLIPPRSNLTIIEGYLYLQEYKDKNSLHLPIDVLFDSLAKDQKEHAIAVVLSGTGSDGSKGIKKINEEGGLVLAQNIETSKFDGMPRSAINTGVCDFVLNPSNIAKEIVNFIKQPTIIPVVEDDKNDFELQQLKRIGIIMNVFSGIDFNMYKSSTILRRIGRRVKVNKLTDIEQYIQYLVKSDKEKEILRKEFLIGVTGFFRDNGAYDELSSKGFEYFDLTKDELRIWIAGCSTGEEAYSVAIRIQEYLMENNIPINYKIFATDINADAIEIANVGFYSDNVVESIPAEILSKYFEKKPSGYRIVDEIRKNIVFAKHNILTDPPFSKLDLLVCRNVLIYIKPEFQDSVIRQFYRSLCPTGVLFLGSSESLGLVSEGFHIIHKKWNIYRKNVDNSHRVLEKGVYNINYRYREPRLHDTVGSSYTKTTTESLLMLTLTTLVDSGFIVDHRDNIVQVINDCNDILKPQPGKFTNNLLNNINKDYGLIVNNIIRRLKGKETSVSYTNISSKDNENVYTINGRLIEVKEESYFLISFLNEKETESRGKVLEVNYTNDEKLHIQTLENELSYAKESLQATVEELETSNEELQSSNEELIASNEELQSTNEELQSVNEELYSVNNEYQAKIDALTSMTNDLNNLLVNTEVAAIYLDHTLSIRKMTPLIRTITNIREEDTGRPILHISVMNEYPNFSKDVEHVSETLMGIDKLVKGKSGRTWLCRIKPYRKEQNIVEGVIITFVEVTDFILEEKKNFITQDILDFVLERQSNGWFRYDFLTNEYISSTGFYTKLKLKKSDIPSSIEDFFYLVSQKDLKKVKATYDTLRRNQSEHAEITFNLVINKKNYEIKQALKVSNNTLIGIMFL